MRKSHLLPVMMFLLMIAQPLFAASSESLSFDCDGNQISTGPFPRISRDKSLSSVPEGVVLRNNVLHEFYPVSGKTFSEIVASVGENGPYHTNLKKRLPTKIVWRFEISYDYDYSSALNEDGSMVHVALDVRNVRITYSVNVTLPSLIDNTSLNPIEKNLWKNLFLRLLEHEYDHVDIIEDEGIANEAKKNLADISYLMFDYREGIDIGNIIGAYLRNEAGKTAKELAATIRERLVEYDRLTDYGNKPSLRDSFFRSAK